MTRRLTLCGALVLAACGSGAPIGKGAIPSLTIENQSNFILQELRIHHDPDFMSVKNVFPGGPMKINASFVFYVEGDWYVTSIHPLVAGDKPIAYTTLAPISMGRGFGYELIVFDQSFRLKQLDKRTEPEDLMGVPTSGDPGPSTKT